MSVCGESTAGGFKLLLGNTVFLEQQYTEKNETLGAEFTRRRSLSINLEKGVMYRLPETENPEFDIPDAVYQKVLVHLRHRCRELYGFEPQYEYGRNNYEKLANFVRYPFCPQLVMFGVLVNRCMVNMELWRTDPEGFNHLCGMIEVRPAAAVRRAFVVNPASLIAGKLLGQLGFTDINICNAVVQEHFTAAGREQNTALWNLPVLKAVFSDLTPGARRISIRHTWTAYGPHSGYENAIESNLGLTGIFCSVMLPVLGEKKTASLLDSMEQNDAGDDTAQLFLKLYLEHRLTGDERRQVMREGFTLYIHDMLLHAYEVFHPPVNYNFGQEELKPGDNTVLMYTEEEKTLEYESGGYSFKLAQDLAELAAISAALKNCVGYLYREKAVSKESIIMYVKKDGLYCCCIELQHAGNKFSLIQCKSFCNALPENALKSVCLEWGRAKNLVISTGDLN